MTLCIKKIYLDIQICLFFIRGIGTNIIFILKLIIQGLLGLYNKDISFQLTKTKALLMASIGKISFNMNGLTIHSRLNIPIQ
jgi:hypothetical protein